MEAKFGHFHKIEDGKIREFWTYDDSQKMARAMKPVM
jgi:ketosteroid isomerase-like protein